MATFNYHGNLKKCMNKSKSMQIGTYNNSSSTTTTNSNNVTNTNSNNKTTKYLNDKQWEFAEIKPQNNDANVPSEEGKVQYSAPGPVSQPGSALGGGSSYYSSENESTSDPNNQQQSQARLSRVNENTQHLRDYYALCGTSNAMSKQNDACFDYPFRPKGAVSYFCDNYNFYVQRITFIYTKHHLLHKLKFVLHQLEQNKYNNQKLQQIYINICKARGEPLF